MEDPNLLIAENEIDEGEIEALLANARMLVNSVYSDLGLLAENELQSEPPAVMEPTNSRATGTQPQSGRRQQTEEDEEELQSSFDVSARGKIIQEEIEKMTRLVEMVDRDLRDALDLGAIPEAVPNSSPEIRSIGPARRRQSRRQNRSSVIDLSSTLSPAQSPAQSQPPQEEPMAAGSPVGRRPLSSQTVVIDLCTPENESNRYVRRRRETEMPMPRVIPWQTNGNVASGDDSRRSNGRFMCAICMDSFLDRQPTSTKCGHIYCGTCIREAIRLCGKCPLCNTRIRANQLSVLYL